MNHTILGAGGSIGNALTYELLKSKKKIRLVSRSGYNIGGTEVFKADIGSYKETLDSVRDSEIVYLCAGLKYDSRVWSELWPRIMKNTIDACKSVGAKLIFFDNVYMYGKVDGKMTESTPYNPCSKKGEIRAKIATQLETEVKQKNIQAIIARAADLYGPYATKTSLPYIMAIDKMMKGNKAQWMVNANTLHSFTYTLDCAKAMAMLSAKDEYFNQTWHMPTFNPPVDGKTFIQIIARETGTIYEYLILKKWMIRMGGLFDRTIHELYEMLYQNEYNYYFDSSKFNDRFHYMPIDYLQGINETIEFLRKGGK